MSIWNEKERAFSWFVRGAEWQDVYADGSLMRSDFEELWTNEMLESRIPGVLCAVCMRDIGDYTPDCPGCDNECQAYHDKRAENSAQREVNFGKGGLFD